MSAFVVSKSHIDALVAVAIEGPFDLRAGRWERPFTWYAPAEAARVGSGLDFWHARRREATLLTADAVGQMLLEECLRSVCCRYDCGRDSEHLPGPCAQYWRAPYHYQRPRRRPSIVEAAKAIRCYEYQSCEHDEWTASEARIFCEALVGALVVALPGYEAAPWEWMEENSGTVTLAPDPPNGFLPRREGQSDRATVPSDSIARAAGDGGA